MSASTQQRIANSPAEPAAVAERALIEFPHPWASRRRLAIAARIVAIAAVAWLAWAPGTNDFKAVQNGRRFSAVDRRQAVEALRAAGIERFRVSNQQLLVEPQEYAAAERALAKQAERADL